MGIVAGQTSPAPTNLAPLAHLLAYVQGLGLERYLDRPKRGVGTLTLSLIWLILAWRGSGPAVSSDAPGGAPAAGAGRRGQAAGAADPVPESGRLPGQGAAGRRRGSLPGRTAAPEGRVWVALDAHQLLYWGRDKKDLLQKGWPGSHSWRVRGYRLYLAVDTDTGQVITYLLARGGRRDHQVLPVLTRRVRALLGRRLAGVVADCGFTSRDSVAAMAETGVPFILGFARSAPIRRRLAALSPQQRRWLRDGGAIRLGACPWDERLRLFALAAREPDDRRGPWVYVTNLRSVGPQRLAATYRRRWRAEQAIEELLNGHDLDHLVGYRLHPNQVAVGFRLLARNLAIGAQLAAAQARPAVIREPRACRVTQVEGLGTFQVLEQTIVVTPLRPPPDDQPYHLPWTRCTVRYAA